MTHSPLPPVAEVLFFSQNITRGRPIYRGAVLHVIRDENGFLATDIERGEQARLAPELLEDMLDAFALPLLDRLDPDQFDVPVEDHYGCIWNGDNPRARIRVRLNDGSVLAATSSIQHYYMIPWDIECTGQTEVVGSSFDIRLPRAIGALLPAQFLNAYQIRGEGLTCGNQSMEAPPEEESETVDESPIAVEETEALVENGTSADYDEQVLVAASGPEFTFAFLNDDDAAESVEAPVASLSQALDQGGDPNARDEHGQTALMNAAWPPFNAEKFQLLVQRGADPNVRRFDGFTGLHLAASGWMAPATRAWLDAGAEVNQVTPHGSSALMLGAGKLEIVRMLLAAGADVNLRDRDGDTAGVYAMDNDLNSEAEKLDILRALLEAGMDPNVVNQKGETLADRVRLWEMQEAIEGRVRDEWRSELRNGWLGWRPIETGHSELAKLFAGRAPRSGV